MRNLLFLLPQKHHELCFHSHATLHLQTNCFEANDHDLAKFEYQPSYVEGLLSWMIFPSEDIYVTSAQLFCIEGTWSLT